MVLAPMCQAGLSSGCQIFQDPVTYMKSIVRSLAVTSLLSLTALSANATVVLVKTSVGNFEVNLYDQTTPATVTNFLSYVNNGSYQNTIFHRTEKGFVAQAGGFRYSGNNAAPFTAVATQAAIKNEPKWSNVRGTIAMAKVSGNPNSATNQWFINLADNSSNLDLQNGGFSVFGQVTGAGMEVIDAIAALPNQLLTDPNFRSVPLRNYSAADAAAQVPVKAANLVLIESITVVNNDVNSAAALQPKANTLITAPTTDSGSSSGGSTGLLSLLAGLLVWNGRRASASRKI